MMKPVNLQNEQNGQTADTWRFGAFEVRGRAGLLFHKGRRVRIQDLPLRMLIILIAHSGEVVSREQLRNLLWGEKTFVEFDTNLRVAAAKLREALGRRRRSSAVCGNRGPPRLSLYRRSGAGRGIHGACNRIWSRTTAALTSAVPEIGTDSQSQSGAGSIHAR